MLALYDLCHIGSGDLYVSDVAAQTNDILRESGETRSYSPKMVGRILNHSLGFPTRRRGDGYRIELTSATCRKIHSQAQGMGLKQADLHHPSSVKSRLTNLPCQLCSEFDMMVDHDGRKLRTIDEVDEEARRTAPARKV